MNLALLALTIASFGIGTGEFVIMGLLPDLSTDLHVSIPRAGLLVSGYALGVTVGAPIVAVATARLARKTALLLLMGLFVCGNLCCALAPGYGLLMLARILTAFCHGAFFGIAAVVAAGLVPRHKRARAVALVFSGLTVANVLGVPLGTAIGQAAGWRATFWVVGAIGLVATGAILFCLPRAAPGAPARLLSEVRVLRRPQVMLTMAISVTSSISLFSVFTFITPMLEHVAGLSPHRVMLALLLFGGGLTVGNLIGGRLADWRLLPSLIFTLCLLIVVLCVFAVTVHRSIPAMVTLFVWGTAAFTLVPPLLLRVVEQASDAPNLASTMNQGAFNLGNATGAWLGGIVVLDAGGRASGYASLPLVGAAVALVALALAALAFWSERKSRRAGIVDA